MPFARQLASRRVLKSHSPGLQDFILQNQIIRTYRDMLRTIHKIPNKSLQMELRTYLKEEFRSSSQVTDYDTRKSLLTGAIRQFKSVTSNLGLSLPNFKL
ncbi:hypothetical protein HPODL_05243 [Ogataea parapolymorpha DL-1]|uniref:Complex 1 LYR protein domain-containing protein n=1 Tax=Ogataea parapolymorpha (strain ATCC 26012 / BCRC 20466 / JCM 22074 / NRRL Y-7560 / DL-1) TaxID=871575 RepID=W1QBD0_OGAPD|nr:hypothetical protein HPODL_05243 [Ogataea parapolymorpha DL-1]ESW98351.1 hypothetical protein HPODL_05243 [Ogataea parapolymorpha DL-1]